METSGDKRLRQDVSHLIAVMDKSKMLTDRQRVYLLAQVRKVSKPATRIHVSLPCLRKHTPPPPKNRHQPLIHSTSLFGTV